MIYTMTVPQLLKKSHLKKVCCLVIVKKNKNLYNISVGGVKKFVTSLNDKNRFVLHYRNSCIST